MAAFIPTAYKRYWLRESTLDAGYLALSIAPETAASLRVALCEGTTPAPSITFASELDTLEGASLVTPTTSSVSTAAVFGIADNPLTFTAVPNGESVSHVAVIWWAGSLATSPVLFVTDAFTIVATNDSDIELTFAQTNPKVFAL